MQKFYFLGINFDSLKNSETAHENKLMVTERKWGDGRHR